MQINEGNQIIKDEDIVQKAVLVGINLNERHAIAIEDSMAELKELVYAAGAEVVQTLVQARQTPDATFLLVKGK